MSDELTLWEWANRISDGNSSADFALREYAKEVTADLRSKLAAVQKQADLLMQIAALLVPLSTHGEGPVEIVTRLIAEQDAARKDSERINWLNDQCEVDIWMRGNPDIDYLATVSCTDGRIITVDDCSTKSFQGATIREAIDAASAALAAKESSDGK